MANILNVKEVSDLYKPIDIANIKDESYTFDLPYGNFIIPIYQAAATVFLF